jgi:adenosine deaminase
MGENPTHTVPLADDTTYLSLPKVELHRHLEGSLRLATMVEIARQHGLEIQNVQKLGALVQVSKDDPYTFQNFLSKFVTLRKFYRSPEIIGRFTQEAVADAAADNVRYLELRFTPVALSAAQGYLLSDVMDWVVEYTRQASLEYGITTNLIVSINRHESVKIAERVVELALERKDQGIVGIDLAGNEAQFPARPFVSLFKEARQSGLHITLHAGEWGGADNVAEALVDFNAERIGHGVRIVEDQSVVDLAQQRGTAFEVCITSNTQSGVFKTLTDHPVIDMVSSGLNVILTTDDPSISQIVLSDEYQTACEDLGLSKAALRKSIMAGAQAAFISDRQKENLLASLERELEELIPAQ